MDNKKIAIYSRKSKFTGKGESIENQIELCKVYIKSKYPDIKDEDISVYEDEGYSGKNTKRPQFQKMLKDGKEKKISGIVCYRLDRISRNVGDFTLLIEELNNYNISFDSINEKFDTSTPMGKAMMYICSIFAQLERETIAERIRDNMHELAKTGRWLGGTTPTGYKSEKIVDRMTIDGKSVTAYKLEIIHEEAEIIKLIFSKFIEYNSLTKTETFFLQNNIKTKNGKSFTRFTIKSILTNPVYMIADKDAWNYFENLGVEIHAEKDDFDGIHGLMGYNKTMQKSGKSNETRDIEEWIIAVGKHPGIISGSDWVKAQSFLEQNTSKSYRKPRSHTALLSGLIVCGKCGSYMRPKIYNRNFEDGERRFSYLCETKEKSKQHNCNIKNPNGNILDKTIIEEIKKLSKSNSNFIKQLENQKNKVKSNSEEFDTQIENLKRSIEEKRVQIDNLINSIANSSNDTAIGYINERINILDTEIKDAGKRLQSIEELTKENVLSENELEILKDMLKSFSNSFDNMSIEQKRLAIRTFVKRIIWDGENIHMYLTGSEVPSDFFPRPDGTKHTEPSGVNSVCYTHLTAPCVEFSVPLSDNKIFKCNNSLIYLHKFRFITPRQASDSIKYNFISSEKELETVADKLRYYRHLKGLKQSDVAGYIGIDRSIYSGYEAASRDYYRPEIMDKIAELFEVDISQLLDDYAMFLYNGQGTYISTFRAERKITQSALAKMMGVELFKVKQWEQNKTRMFKSTWEKLMELDK